MKTVDISGLGGPYEAACQLMLLNGLKWLREHPEFQWGKAYQSYRSIYGLLTTHSEEAKGLDAAICEDVEPTGAMHQAVISHLAYISKHGYEAWLASAKPERIYEIDEEELRNQVLIGKIEWQLKLDRGYNPMADLFKQIPPENVIHVNMENEDDLKAAARRIAEILGRLTNP